MPFYSSQKRPQQKRIEFSLLISSQVVEQLELKRCITRIPCKKSNRRIRNSISWWLVRLCTSVYILHGNYTELPEIEFYFRFTTSSPWLTSPTAEERKKCLSNQLFDFSTIFIFSTHQLRWTITIHGRHEHNPLSIIFLSWRRFSEYRTYDTTRWDGGKMDLKMSNLHWAGKWHFFKRKMSLLVFYCFQKKSRKALTICAFPHSIGVS